MKVIKHIISILGLWLIVSIVSGFDIPFIIGVLSQFGKDYDQVLIHTVYSSLRIIVAIAISILLGTSIALWMVRNKIADDLLNPFINSWYPIPKAALTPMFIMVFGLGEVAKVSLLVFVTIFPVIIAVRKSILNFPTQYTRIINVYNVSGRDLMIKIYLKGALKELLTTIKLVTGIAVAVLYLSESSFGSAKGIGYYISRNMGVNPDGVILGIIMLSLIGVALFTIIDVIERKYIKW